MPPKTSPMPGVIPLTRHAAAQVRAMDRYYAQLERPEAIRNLAAAIRAAQTTIPILTHHLVAPRPYPELAVANAAWIKQGRYWIRYRVSPPIITAVLFETMDLPRHV